MLLDSKPSGTSYCSLRLADLKRQGFVKNTLPYPILFYLSSLIDVNTIEFHLHLIFSQYIFVFYYQFAFAVYFHH